MAGIFERIGDILSSNINALLDKAEDPGKMVDQYLRKAKEDLADVRKNTAAVMAEEKRCKRLVDEAKQEVKELTAYAEKAVLAGNDGDATIFLTKSRRLPGGWLTPNRPTPPPRGTRTRCGRPTTSWCLTSPPWRPARPTLKQRQL